VLVWVVALALLRGGEVQQAIAQESATSTPAVAVAVNLTDTVEWQNCAASPADCTSMCAPVRLCWHHGAGFQQGSSVGQQAWFALCGPE
jgi:hypothetical protein